jgi:hypothetical protein
MPSTSKKQHNFMAAIAHNPAFAKKVGIPQSVGKDFNEADKGKKFGSGGRADLQKINRAKTNHGKLALFKEGGSIMAKSSGNGITTAKMGSVRTAAPSRDGVASKGKTKGTMISMSGGKVLGTKVSAGNGMKSGGMTKKMNYGGKC